uniref:Uncharacterized protein n=1 Tax=Strombidium rassoulzadegani TaxID=1082188 RepID=A0A7S3CS80_9SPIT|mmetsp:Transcript_3243/g.5387  ORF Transcript_3243/g.5387 Transcript_3243/m.5387 type:complete len:114 (+) Transcript_3243:92-433(+)
MVRVQDKKEERQRLVKKLELEKQEKSEIDAKNEKLLDSIRREQDRANLHQKRMEMKLKELPDDLRESILFKIRDQGSSMMLNSILLENPSFSNHMADSKPRRTLKVSKSLSDH